MKLSLLLCLFFLLSCSTTEEKPEVKTYSAETNRAFELIERGGSYYLKKPESQNRPAPQVKPKYHAKTPTPEKDPEIVIEDIKQEQVSPSVTKPKVVKSPKHDEKLIEINQNLAFYCMKHRKDKRFADSEEKCMDFVSQSLEQCQKIHSNSNSKLLSCVQQKLKRR